MADFIIHERAVVQWQWGPLMSLAIPLEEIDSAGPSPCDVMQIIDDTTNLATQSAILLCHTKSHPMLHSRRKAPPHLASSPPPHLPQS